MSGVARLPRAPRLPYSAEPRLGRRGRPVEAASRRPPAQPVSPVNVAPVNCNVVPPTAITFGDAAGYCAGRPLSPVEKKMLTPGCAKWTSEAASPANSLPPQLFETYSGVRARVVLSRDQVIELVRVGLDEQDPRAGRDRVGPLDVQRDLERPVRVLVRGRRCRRPRRPCGSSRSRSCRRAAEARVDVEVALDRRIIVGVDDRDRCARPAVVADRERYNAT